MVKGTPGGVDDGINAPREGQKENGRPKATVYEGGVVFKVATLPSVTVMTAAIICCSARIKARSVPQLNLGSNEKQRSATSFQPTVGRACP
jgi:hypothetical protein